MTTNAERLTSYTPEQSGSGAKDDGQQFAMLTATPTVSIPGLGMVVLGVAIFISATMAAMAGTLPVALAVILNGFSLYLFFSLMHDAIHENASSHKATNELLGRVSLFFMMPYAPLEIARWIHLKHHAHTACASDPDNFMHHGRWWVLPLRWANFDVFYTAYFVKAYFDGEAIARRYALAVGLYVVALIGIVTGFIVAGYGLELLIYWFIPSRIGLMLTGCVFVFLPHHPANISAHQDKYAASTIRQGWEWLLTPLMAYHNYHLIHHLYPQVPFYNYIKMWRLRGEEILTHNPAMQGTFKLRPANR